MPPKPAWYSNWLAAELMKRRDKPLGVRKAKPPVWPPPGVKEGDVEADGRVWERNPDGSLALVIPPEKPLSIFERAGQGLGAAAEAGAGLGRGIFSTLLSPPGATGAQFAKGLVPTVRRSFANLYLGPEGEPTPVEDLPHPKSFAEGTGQIAGALLPPAFGMSAEERAAVARDPVLGPLTFGFPGAGPIAGPLFQAARIGTGLARPAVSEAVRAVKPVARELATQEGGFARLKRGSRPPLNPIQEMAETQSAAATTEPTQPAGAVNPPAASATPIEEAGAGGIPPKQPPAAQAAPSGRTPRRPIWAGLGKTGGTPELPTAAEGVSLPSGRKPGGPDNMTPYAPQDELQKVIDAVTPVRPAVKDRITTGKDAMMRQFYAYWYPLRELSSKTGVPADKLIQVVPGSTAAGEDLVRRYFRPVWQPVAKDVASLEQYMVIMRNHDILARNPHALLPGNVGGWRGTLEAETALQKKLGPERFAAIKGAAEKLWQLNDELVLQPLRGEGLLNGTTYTALKSAGPHYIPFKRADFTDELSRGFTRPEANVSSMGIQKMALEGSDRFLDNPLARLEAQVIKTQNLIARNKAARSIVEALQTAETAPGEFVKFIEPKGQLSTIQRVTTTTVPRLSKAEHSTIWDTISYFDKGERVTVEVPALYATVAKGMEAESSNLLGSVLSALSAPLRKGATTYNPAFLVINPLRDGYSALYRERLIPLSPEYLRGWAAVVSKNDLFQEAAQSGALMSGIVDTMRSTEAMSRVRTLGAISVKNPLDALLLIPRLLEKANITAEQATRVATFGKLRAEGLDALSAGVRSRDVSVDFAKMGTTMRVVNQVIPFSNAGLQGSANFIRTMRDNPKWALVMAGVFATPTILSRVNNMRFETSKDIPLYEYTNNWVIQLGEGAKPDGTRFPIYMKFPKGQIGSMMTFPGEAMFNFAQAQGDRSAGELLLEAGLQSARATSPIEPDVSGVLPPIVRTGTGVSTGTNLYTGAPVIPRREEALLPEQQFGAETSKVAVALGQATGTSPRLIDFAIKDYTAGTGQAGMWLLDVGLGALRYNPEPYGAARAEGRSTIEQVARIPGVSRFMGTKATEQERQGWDKFNKVSDETNREFARLSGMNALGLRLGSVGTSLDLRPGLKGGSVDLTPQQRAQYQQVMGQIVIEGLREFLPDLDPALPSESQKELVQAEIGRLKKIAMGRFMLRHAEELIGLQEPTPPEPVSPVQGTEGPGRLSPRAQEWMREYEKYLPAGAGR